VPRSPIRGYRRTSRFDAVRLRAFPWHECRFALRRVTSSRPRSEGDRSAFEGEPETLARCGLAAVGDQRELNATDRSG
jgi:hypothetical protein